MQLLEVINRMFFVVSMALASAGTAFADVDCSSEVLTNPDIVICSNASLVKVDKVLNEQYKFLTSTLDVSLKADLLTTQKAWVKFKDVYCKEDEVNGSEAPINSIVCMTELTSFRLNELIYLRTGVTGDGFYKAVSLVNAKNKSMDYEKAVQYVAGAESFGREWEIYAKSNCLMTKKMYGENFDRCMSRMRFQIPIY
ncbi:DUF1311 domain-containing protein [Pseudomonas viridiflava]|uniref:lysozyme inhibitor LprI family protein n=1 Tax=Pseudomonas viridiflava TaxID=33069 RepID=UPI0018E61D3E|nr:lysozyme inhibitor LprI family protein [Pseudomonas viridiflava]MBI6682383.1 DUF1311 domain-containing protein [Pseudomonas viridiflava]